MNKKVIIILVFLLVSGFVVITVILKRSDPDIIPRDEVSAKLTLQQALRRKGIQVKDDQIEPISTRNGWIADLWVFGILNPMVRLLGGPRYEEVYLVGPSVVPSPSLGVDSSSVTSDFLSAFKWRVSHKPPTSETEAFDIAKCYVCLETRTRPSKFKVLERAELPVKLEEWLPARHPDQAELIRTQIVAPQVNASQVIGLKNGSVFTVELCSFSEDYWGDITFWYIVIGEETFSVAKRYIYYASRVLA